MCAFQSLQDKPFCIIEEFFTKINKLIVIIAEFIPRQFGKPDMQNYSAIKY